MVRLHSFLRYLQQLMMRTRHYVIRMRTLHEKSLKTVLIECYYFCNDHSFDPETDICLKIVIFSSWLCHKDNTVSIWYSCLKVNKNVLKIKR